MQTIKALWFPFLCFISRRLLSSQLQSADDYLPALEEAGITLSIEVTD